MGTQRPVHLEEAEHLVEDVVEVPGLDPVHIAGVAVHGVARPHHGMAGGVDLLDDRGEHLADASRAHPGNDREPARDVLGVEPIDQRQDVVRGRVRTHLAPDGIADPRHQVHMRTVEITGTLADPEHVCGHVVDRASRILRPGQGALVVQQQCLVAGEQLDAVQIGRAFEVDAAGGHERQRPFDVGRHDLVPTPGRRVPHERLVPLVHLRQVSEPTGGEGPDEVQRDRAGMVGVHQPAGVGPAGHRRRGDVVDRIAAVGRQPRARLDVG